MSSSSSSSPSSSSSSSSTTLSSSISSPSPSPSLTTFTEENELFLDTVGIVALTGYTTETRNTLYLNKTTYHYDHHLGLAFVSRPIEVPVPIAPYFNMSTQKTDYRGSYLVQQMERSSLWYAILRNDTERIRYLLRFLDKYTLNKIYYSYESIRIPYLHFDTKVNVPTDPVTMIPATEAITDPSVLRRIRGEIMKTYQNSWPFIYIKDYPPTNVSCHDLRAALIGPPSSPYAGGMFHITVHYRKGYPFTAPTISVHTKMYHPFVGQKHWCYLNNDQWSPALTLPQILFQIHALLDLDTIKACMLASDQMLNTEAAHLYLTDREKFIRIATRTTRRYAQPTYLEKVLLLNNFFVQGTPFLLAVHKGDTVIARMLLAAGADIEAIDYYGNNALVIGIHNNDIEMVKLLLEYHINAKTTVSGRGESLYELLTDTPIMDDLTEDQEREVRQRRREIFLLLERYGYDFGGGTCEQ